MPTFRTSTASRSMTPPAWPLSSSRSSGSPAVAPSGSAPSPASCVTRWMSAGTGDDRLAGVLARRLRAPGIHPASGSLTIIGSRPTYGVTSGTPRDDQDPPERSAKPMSGRDQISVNTPSSSPASLPEPAQPSTGKGPLHQTASTTATDYWNDSCSIEELTYAIERGAVGATTNPTIVGDVLKKEMHLWRERIGQIVDENPTWTEDEITWRLIEEMAVRGAAARAR